MNREVRVPAQIRAQRSWPIEFVPNQNSLLGGNIVQRQTPLVVVNENGILLIGEVGLNKGEQQHRHHDEQEKDRDLILEKRPEGGFPVGIIGIAAPLRVLGVEFGKGEGFLVAHFRRDILLKLLGELVAQGVGGLVA